MQSTLHSLLAAGLSATIAVTPASAQTASKPAEAAAKPAPAASAMAQSAAVPAKPEWQLRRERFLQILEKLRNDDAQARFEFERLVRTFERKPFSLTPLEAMDYIGAVFVPQAGVDKLLPLVAAQAALGLYDIARFGSDLGEVQLTDLEAFLRLPLAWSGPEQAEKSKAYLRDNPARAARLVQEGLQLADGERQAPSYDNRWVRDLGRCAPEIAATCPRHRDVAPAEWDALWGKVKQRVTDYYRIETPAPGLAASAPTTSTSTSTSKSAAAASTPSGNR